MREHETTLEDSKYNVLLWAIRNGYSNLVKELLRSGMDIETKIEDGMSILSMSVLYPSILHVTKILVEFGADIESEDNNGWTPLLHAIQQENISAIEYLIKKGADVNVTSEGGWTPLMEARMVNNFKITELLKQNGAKEVCSYCSDPNIYKIYTTPFNKILYYCEKCNKKFLNGDFGRFNRKTKEPI